MQLNAEGIHGLAAKRALSGVTRLLKSRGLVVAGLVIVLVALSGRLARNLSYNTYGLLMASYLRNDCVEAQSVPFSRPYLWLRSCRPTPDEWKEIERQ